MYRRARERNREELGAVEQQIATAKPVVAAARTAGLDDAVIGRIYREAELREYGSGWAVVARATEERVQRKAAAEAAARGLDDAALKRIQGEATTADGSGGTAVTRATTARVQRKSESEAAARRVLVDVDAVYKGARARNADDLDALEQETTKAGPVVATARTAGLGDAAIKRIRDGAESEERSSGWAAVSEATEELTEQRRELAAEEQRKLAVLANRTAEVQATWAGAERLEGKRRARLEETKRSLTLDEELVVGEVKGTDRGRARPAGRGC